MRTVLVDKGCLCNSLFHYPSNMTFFTTPELLEIGDMPFPSPNQKPNRDEALEYYRKVAEHYRLDVRQYETVQRVEGSGRRVSRADAGPLRTREQSYRARKIVVATGYYDLPNYLEIPGEDAAQGDALLRRAASVLRHGCGGDRGEELRGDCGAGPMAARRAGDAGAPRHRGSITM